MSRPASAFALFSASGSFIFSGSEVSRVFNSYAERFLSASERERRFARRTNMRMSEAMSARPARDPGTPPAMAPVYEGEEEDDVEERGEELDDVVVSPSEGGCQ